MTRAWKVLVVPLVAALCSCAGHATVVSVKRAWYTRPLDRVVVFVDTGRMPAPVGAAFKSKLITALEERGVKARLDDSGKRASILEQAKAFQASTVLAMVPSSRAHEKYGTVLQHFDGELLDLPTEKVVWRAQFEWGAGSVLRSGEARADPMVDEIVAAFLADGLVPRVVEKAAAPAARNTN